MKHKIIFKQTRAILLGDINSLNLLVLFCDNRTLIIRGNDLRVCADAKKGTNTGVYQSRQTQGSPGLNEKKNMI